MKAGLHSIVIKMSEASNVSYILAECLKDESVSLLDDDTPVYWRSLTVILMSIIMLAGIFFKGTIIHFIYTVSPKRPINNNLLISQVSAFTTCL